MAEPITDALIKHAVGLERYKGGVVAKIVALLNRADSDLMAQIIARDPNAVSGAWSQKRLEALLVEIRKLNKSAYEAVGKELTKELREFAAHESGWQAQLLENSIPGVSITAPAPVQVQAAALARPFQGRLLKEALDGIEASRAARIRDAIRLGYVEGETVDQIVRRLRGTRAAQYADGLLEIDRRGAAALVRTAIAHTANVAREATWAANDDVVTAWQFLAVLDSRTSLTCASLSGKEFPIGKGPQPPRHWNCRSVSVPILKDELESLFSSGTRSSMDGPVDRNLSFSDWLRGQPVDVQDDILGSTRGALFRANKITVDKFTDRRGNVYDLETLRRKDAQLFEKAGLVE